MEEPVEKLHSFSIQRFCSHSLALAFSDACDENSTAVLDSARQVVEKLQTANVNKLLVQKGLPKAILDIVTRCGSTFDMLDRFLNLKSACIDLAGIIPQLQLSSDVWVAIEELHSCMRPAQMATARLQSQKITAGDLLAEFEVLIKVICWLFPTVYIGKVCI